jgi:hypothetical protein
MLAPLGRRAFASLPAGALCWMPAAVRPEAVVGVLVPEEAAGVRGVAAAIARSLERGKKSPRVLLDFLSSENETCLWILETTWGLGKEFLFRFRVIVRGSRKELLRVLFLLQIPRSSVVVVVVGLRVQWRRNAGNADG